MAMELKAGELAEKHSRQIIWAGFAVVLVVIFIVVYFANDRLNQVHASLNNVVSSEMVAIEHLYRMQEAARDRSVLLYKIVSTKDPFARDEQILLHSRMGNQFVLARQNLKLLNLGESEVRLLEDINKNVSASQELQNKVLNEISVDRLRSAQEILNDEAVPVQQALLGSIRTFLEYELEESHEYAEALQKQQAKNRALLILGGLLAALVAVMIAAHIDRRMNALIGGLTAAARKLQDANMRMASLNLALDQHNIVSIADVSGNITYVNDKFCEISQYSAAELLGQNHRIVNSGVHPQEFFEEMWETIASGKVWQGEVCNKSKGGNLYWVSSTIVPFLDENGLPYQYISMRTDITAIKQAEQVLMRGKQELEALVHERTRELEEREKVLESIATAAQDAVIMMDSMGDVTYWNPAAEKMFGYAPDEILGMNLHGLLVPARYLDAHHAAFPKFVQTGAGPLIGAVSEVEALRKSGAEFPVEISIAAVSISNSWHAVAIVRDITIRKQAEEQLKLLASTDVLTGICNRRRFNEVLQVEIARAKRFGTPFTLIIFDIDHFKRINDTYGHPAGDQVLLKLSLVVAKNIRSTDLFARWGGEEFVILATNCETHCPHSLAEKLRKLVEAYPFAEVGKVTCSFGATDFQAGDNEESLIRRADHNLYQAKESGRNRVVCGANLTPDGA